MDFMTLEQPVWTRLQLEMRAPLCYMVWGTARIRFSTGLTRSASGQRRCLRAMNSSAGTTCQGLPGKKKLSEVLEAYGEDIVIVIAFASQRPEVLEKMYALDARFDVVAPDVPVVPGPVFDTDFVCAHQAELEQAYSLLADSQSQRVFMDTVRFKLSGRLQYLRVSETDKDEVFFSCSRPVQDISLTSGI